MFNPAESPEQEEVAKAMAMAMYGGYPIALEDRLQWDKWYGLLQGAKAALEWQGRKPKDPVGRKIDAVRRDVNFTKRLLHNLRGR